MADAETIRIDYDASATRYADLVDNPAKQEPLPSAMIAAFAESVSGRVLDAGCGPGTWTAFLHERGLVAEGVDLSPGQIETARERYPDLSFAVGSILSLEASDATFEGVLANFSLIHTPPADFPQALDELARVLVDDGLLLLGGFCDLDTETWSEFDHVISPAFRWSPDMLVALMERSGLRETARLIIQPSPTARFPGVYLRARKNRTMPADR